ncbi:hypothetical protein LV779_14610 [Streptomyces thinghirensis]|nr:hypothetical protein [Streptomyces thinghirensis]
MEPRGYRGGLDRTQLRQGVRHSRAAADRLIRGKWYDPSGLDEGRTEIAPHATLDRDSEGRAQGRVQPLAHARDALHGLGHLAVHAHRALRP